MHYSLKRMWALLGVVAVISATVAASATAAHKAGPNIVIWTDQDRTAAVTKVANAWAAKSGATVQVVTKANFTDIRDNLGTVAAADAPDVITAAHDWTGQLAANGLVQPLYPSKAVRAQFPSYTLNAFWYGTAVKKLYGIPVAVENIGLVVNTGSGQGADVVLAAREARRSRSRSRSTSRSASPFSRAPPATRTTCTRSSRVSVATSSARTRRGTSIRPTSASPTRRS